MGFWWSSLARLLRSEPPRDQHAELLILQLRMLQSLGRIERTLGERTLGERELAAQDKEKER